MSPYTLKTLVEGSSALVSLPDVFLRINAMINDQGATLQDIGDVVVLDASLTARLLKVVNSPLYGYDSRISTISRAITLIGLNDFHHLLLSTCAADMFKRIPSSLVNMTDFWLHSIYCAVIARQLAKHCAVLHTERFFVAGMLHQVGSLLIYLRMPDESRELLLHAEGRFWQVAELEQARWGFSYADVGAELARQWRLPESLCVMLGCHLQPEQAGDYLFDTMLLHLAHRLKNFIFQGDVPTAEIVEDILTRASDVVELTENHILAILSAAPDQAERALHMLEGE